MTYTIEWASEADTDVFAQKLANQVEAGDIICLEGNLGAGKTTFTDDIPLYHMDAYRLEETGSDSVGLEDYLNGDGVTIIEWPQFVAEDLPKDYLWITLTASSETSREVTLTYEGPRGQALYDGVVADLA